MSYVFGALPTHYTSKSGKVTKITAMVPEHLDNAIAKLQRTRRDPVMLNALHAERARRARPDSGRG